MTDIKMLVYHVSRETLSNPLSHDVLRYNWMCCWSSCMFHVKQIHHVSRW